MEGNKSEIQNSLAIEPHRVCYNCTLPILDPEVHTCPRCNNNDLDSRRARPNRKYSDLEDPPALPHPWSHLKLEHGGTILLSGNAGSGKTTIALKTNPTRYMSSEQQIQMVFSSWNRVVGQHNPMAPVPRFSMINTWEELEEDLIGLEKDDLIVVDSISQLATSWESTHVMKAAINRIQAARARGIFIAQYTKDGDVLGPNQLRHLVDVLADIPDDMTGLRRLSIRKNRFGNVFSHYFSLDEKGVVEQPFPYCYSIEGSAGNYDLHLYPTSGAKLRGIFEDLEEHGVRMMGCASSAIRCNLYDNGYAEPPDVEARKQFAERHGLTWITPVQAIELIQSHAQETLPDAT